MERRSKRTKQKREKIIKNKEKKKGTTKTRERERGQILRRKIVYLVQQVQANKARKNKRKEGSKEGRKEGRKKVGEEK